MEIEISLLNTLAKALEAERKRQKLSREEAASVCGVSASFIRDVEANPENCSLGKLVRLINGLGLSLNVAGLPMKGHPKNHPGLGVHLANLSKRPDFGVSDDQIVPPSGTRRSLGLDVIPSQSKSEPS